MLSKLLSTTAIATALVAAMPASISFADDGHRGVQHVLLLSIDGFHAVDLEICVAKGTCPNLAKLTEHGIVHERLDNKAFGFVPRPLGPGDRWHVQINRRLLRRQL